MRRTGPTMDGRALVLLLAGISCGCRGRENAPAPPPQAASPSSAAPSAAPLEMRLGWVTGSCLATSNRSLAPGSLITVISLDDKRPIVAARIGGTASDATCPPLLPDRRRQNVSK